MTRTPCPEIITLDSLLKEKIWGGKRLGTPIANMPIGESWKISDLKGGQSTFKGLPLREQFQGRELEIFGEQKGLSYLVKLIDTEDNLSVQVHPDNSLAHALEGGRGKDECWFILGAHKGAGIYLGTKQGVTEKGFSDLVKEGADLSRELNFIPVAPGDFFYVPAGTIHAIGKGVFLAEVQQSSGITYRLWDWNRMDEKGLSRELHLEKGLRAATFCSEHLEKKIYNLRESALESGHRPVISHSDFNVDFCWVSSKNYFYWNLLGNNNKRPTSLLILEGEVHISRGQSESLGEQYSSFLLPCAGEDKVKLKSKTASGASMLIIS